MAVMMFGYAGGWPLWETALMWVGIIAFLGLLIWAVYALVNAARKPLRDQYPQAAAARILDERLARGEINADEYQRLRDLIGSGRSGSPVSGG
jgi:putative membrane protein